MKKIIYALILMLLISGCSFDNNVVKQTPAPSIMPTETSGVEDEVVKDEYLIQPLLNVNSVNISNGYQRYELNDEYYVISLNEEYGVMNNDNQLILDIEIPFITYAWDGTDLFGDDMTFDLQDTDLKQATWDSFQATIIYYDLENKEVLTRYAFGEGPAILSEFDAEICGETQLLDYIDISDVQQTIWDDGSSDHYKFKESDKKGVMDGKGNILTQCIYEDVFNIKSELIPVKNDGLWGYVDINGVEVIPCIYQATFFEKDYVTPYYPYPVVDGRIVVKNQEGKYGVIDTLGNTLIEFEYDYGSPYYDNSVILKKDGEWIVK